jgi:type I restriction enzyme, S subunit
VPPAAEQDEIALTIALKAAKFDDLVEEATQAMSLLQERRTALISAAVTVKIDVRASAQRHGQEAPRVLS